MLKKRYAKNTYGPKCQNTHVQLMTHSFTNAMPACAWYVVHVLTAPSAGESFSTQLGEGIVTTDQLQYCKTQSTIHVSLQWPSAV